MQTIVLGGGCFWCLEAVYQRVSGVSKVVSGYAGGFIDNPSYYDVCTGNTGHAEVVEITFDESVISLRGILEVFFATHDPTTENQQGNDRGTQYRSIIFYQTEFERKTIDVIVKEHSLLFSDPIVTQVEPAVEFWPAEGNHQNYYNDNTQQPYCQVVVGDKLKKLEQYLAKTKG